MFVAARSGNRSGLCGREPAASPADAAAYAQAVDRAIDFLQNKAQAPDGSYAAQSGPGVTAVVTTAILRHGRTPSDPLVAKSLKYLEGFVQPDGAISLEEQHVPELRDLAGIGLFCRGQSRRPLR